MNIDEIKKKVILWFKDTFETLFVALIMALIIRALLVQVFWIPSESMIPTLNINDRLIVNKLAFGIQNPLYRFDVYDKFLYIFPNPFYHSRVGVFNPKYIWEFPNQPARFNVIVFRYPFENDLEKVKDAKSNLPPPQYMPEPPKDLIKRVIGLPGETIQIKRGVLFVNGKPVNETFQKFDDYSNYGPVKIPARHFLMMGDNRPNSNDGRYWGLIKKEDIDGPVLIRIWPLSSLGLI